MTAELQSALQRVIQSERLRQAGIDESRLGSALTPVTMAISRTGEEGGEAGIAAAKVLAFLMSFAIYLVVIMYGQSIMSSVQEEKRDRVVELIVSSVRAKDLLVGKVLGIGAAGVLQMAIWVVAAAVLMAFGGQIATALGAAPAMVAALTQQSIIPDVPLSVGIIFLLYFAGGFLLFATMFAVVGSIVTTAQEAQQFVFPILIPLMLGFFMAMPSTDNPNGAVAVIGSLIPFTSPIVMPVRATITGVDWVQTGISLVLLYGTASLMIWLAARIYRTAIFATGKKPSMLEIARWMRAS
jgi:ABC-2 type transport system permease protein